MRIAICIATCRRPAGLERLLAALARLSVPAGAELAVVVVDNDPGRSARRVVRGTRLPWPVAYRVEPRPGVSFVRNTALDAAAGSDLVAFVDDDETPTETWLTELVAVQRQTGAAAVCGPVVPVFAGRAPAWLAEGFGLCYAQLRPNARGFDVSAGNLLLAGAVLRSHGIRFDETLSLVGGEDTALTWQLEAAGERIVWAERAVVHEHVPPGRANLRWLIRRWYRTGNVEALLAMRRQRGLVGRGRGLVGGLARIGVGGIRFVLALPAFVRGRREHGVRRLYTLCRGLGMVASVCGHRHLEYRAVHGAT